jgi:uncharacterized SAM-binding protein YcdF (DUF218 family)
MSESFSGERINHSVRPYRGVEDPSFFEKLPRADVVIVPGAELKWTPGETAEQRELYEEQQVRAGIETKMRAIAAFELLRQGVVRKIIFTGGVMENESFGQQLAEVSRTFVLDIIAKHNETVPPEERLSEHLVLIAGDSKNSAEDIEEGLKVARENHDASAYVETTGFHVPRVMITAEHLKEKYGITEGIHGISAEDILRARSSHYEDLLGYFEFPESVARQPKLALKKGIRELVRRTVMKLFDPSDEMGRKRARKERSKADS